MRCKTLRVSANSNILPCSKFGVTGQESRPQSPGFNTADRFEAYR